jgi:peptide subunit release factor 1 (eRF1)
MTRINIYDGVIRSRLVAELESFRDPGKKISSYYFDVNPKRWGNGKATRIALKNALEDARHQIRDLEFDHDTRQTLLRDLELVSENAPSKIGERHTLGLACYVASHAGFCQAVRSPWPVRNRAFFEDQFVLWPLRQILDQVDRWGILLSDKDDARLFLFQLEQIEEVVDVFDEIPGKIRFPEFGGELKYLHKHQLYYHKHFSKVSELALRLLQRENIDHLIIGGLGETLPQFESYLHRYLRNRILARWDIDVHTPIKEIQERAQHEEEQFGERRNQEIWQSIQDHRSRAALGHEEVFVALWWRQVETMLIERNRTQPGYCCSNCGRLQVTAGPCKECQGTLAEIPDVFEEAVHVAIEQSAHVRYWKADPQKVHPSIAAINRF